MQAEIESFFADDVNALVGTLAGLEAQIDPAAIPRKDERFGQLSTALSLAVGACRRVESLLGDDAGLVKDVQKRFQEETSPWFDRSWIGHRARAKPQGYPGDYDLLTAIYDEEIRSGGLGGYLDLYIVNMLLAKAIRARWQAARRFLIEEVARRRDDVFILNVACGCCREYVGGMELPDQCNVHVTCIDNDRQALEYVSANVVPVATGIEDIELARYNALRMRSAKSTIRKFGRCDVLYSIGLCDYIPDRHLIPLLEGWRDSLSQGGVLYVAFKDIRRYDITEYRWLLDWHFLKRTEDECRRLFEQAGFDMDGLGMSRDATGVMMNFIARVRRPAIFSVAPWQGLKTVAES
jgi:extracellular factor (EF) 3-hydroxypalmitic acid methyl ester biosynthesis protein